MDIVIPTLGRPHAQATFDNMPDKWKDRTTLIVQPHEAEAYRRRDYPCAVLDPEIKGIAATRHAIVYEMGFQHRFICMLDDDLVFSARRTDEPTKFRPMTDQDWDFMFWELEERLNKFVHVGVSHREGANRNTQPLIQVGRQMRVLAFDTRYLKDNGITWGRMPLMEDFDMTLRLLRLGKPNAILNKWVHNQAGSNTGGGCSTFRTAKGHADAAHKLAALHPRFVKTVHKQTKDGWMADEHGYRTDVRIQWKKAYDSAPS